MNKKSSYAVLSGGCASMASVCGKLCGLSTLQDLLVLRIFLFVLLVVCNCGVWTLFVKALQATESSLTPTIIATTSNYLISAIAGLLIFGEVTSLMWWSGTALIVCGLVLIVRDEYRYGDASLGKVEDKSC